MWRVEFDVNFRNSKTRNYPERVNIFDMDDSEFLSRHKFPKVAVENICDLLRISLERFTHRSQSLSVETQVCVALRYYCVGGFMKELGDLYGISEKSAGRCIHSVSSSISKILGEFISWPSSTTIYDIQDKFSRISNGIPRIIGIIGGCHMPIRAPSAPFSEVEFVNDNGWHSINAQIIWDCDFRIIDLNAGFPGSNNDSSILKQLSVYDRFQRDCSEGFLLGDCSYPLLPWLMTPILKPTSILEERYNVSHKRTCSIAKRCSGILKSRFQCLTKEIMFNPEKASKIIEACACLHNYAISLNLPDESMNIADDSKEQCFVNQSTEISTRGRETRNQLILTSFSK